MLVSLRAFRLPAALLAALMLLSGSLPLVQHACALLARHLHACCDEARHADARPDHHGQQADAPCHEQPASHASPRGATAECCLVQNTPALPAKMTPYEAPLTRLLAALPALSFDASPTTPDDGRSLSLFFDTGPPAGSAVALHLFHSVLLN